MNKISCPQTQCSHNQIGIGEGCKKCEECGCEPNVIDQNCNTCMNCANKVDCLRWDNSSNELLLKDKKEIKVMEIL